MHDDADARLEALIQRRLAEGSTRRRRRPSPRNRVTTAHAEARSVAEARLDELIQRTAGARQSQGEWIRALRPKINEARAARLTWNEIAAALGVKLPSLKAALAPQRQSARPADSTADGAPQRATRVRAAGW